MLEIAIEDYVEASKIGMSARLAADYLDISPTQVHALTKKGVLKRVRIFGNRADYNQLETTSVRAYYQHTHGTEDQLDRLTEKLEAAAEKKKLVMYNDVMPLLGLDHRKSLDRSIIGRLLGSVTRASMKTKGVMLSAIVVQKTTRIPSSSFFEFAVSLEVPGAVLPNEKFHAQHVKKVFSAYA